MNSEVNQEQISTCLDKEKATEEVRGTLKAWLDPCIESSPKRLHEEIKEEEKTVESPGIVES